MQNIIYSLSYLFGIFSCILPSPETMLHHFVTTDGLIRVSKKQKIPNSFYFSISVLGMCHILYDLVATGIILAVCMPSFLFDSVYLITKKNIEILVRSSRTEVFYKKGVLRYFAKFTGKHVCHSLFFQSFWHRCFPVNFARFLRTPFLAEYLRWLLLIGDSRMIHL